MRKNGSGLRARFFLWTIGLGQNAQDILMIIVQF